MSRKERDQWLGSVSTVERDRWPIHLLTAGDHIWNRDINCWQVWNGITWVNICPGGAGSSKAEPEVIVGNAPAGDTPADCDFLDPGDGSAIVTAFLVAPAIGAHIYIKRGTYTPAAPLSVPPKIELQGSGVGTFIRAAAGQPALIITGSDTSIRAMRIEGVRVSPNLSNIIFEMCTIENSNIDGIQIQSGCEQVVIVDCNIRGSTGDGVDIINSNYCTIRGGLIIDNGGHGIHIRNTSKYTGIDGHCIIRNNVGQGIMIATVSDEYTILIDCVLQGNAAPQLTNNSPNTTEKVHYLVL